MVNHWFNEAEDGTFCGEIWGEMARAVSVSDPTRVSCPECSECCDAPTADEVRVVSETGGEKGQKMARWDLLPVKPLWEVAELYGEGAKKYAERNWEKGYPWSLSFAALCRHLWLFWGGESRDEGTGKHHLASVVFHALALMEFEETHPAFDDRPVNLRKDFSDARIDTNDGGSAQ